MIIDDEQVRSIRYDPEADTVHIIDQTRLPHELKIVSLHNLADACHAIASMQVRGAPLIGVTAAYGLYLALREDPSRAQQARCELTATRPTAVNLQWALEQVEQAIAGVEVGRRAAVALDTARRLEREDVAICEAIGEHGAQVLKQVQAARTGRNSVLNVMTHCNAGALATVDWGTALAAIYKAALAGLPLHVWVDETRPRNQGAALTCWELGKQGIPHTLVIGNAAGHLMQRGLVDVCLVGSDRTTIDGDVCNKVGTYLKALAARDNGVPFYVALPVSSIDFSMGDGAADVPIEERNGEEVSLVEGIDTEGVRRRIRVAPPAVQVANYGFDVTPAHLVTAVITERGVFAARRSALRKLQG